jgi:small subunit ribosomal protein S20
MPIIKSAKKRVKVANKAAIRNSKTKRSLRGALKSFTKSPSAKSHSAVQKEVDKAVKKGVIHKNKAARLKSRSAAKAKASGSKATTATKKAVSKPAAKAKTSVKKAAPKKK